MEEDTAAPLRSGVQRSSSNPQIKRRCGPRCVVPQLTGEVKLSGRRDFRGGGGCLWHNCREQAAGRFWLGRAIKREEILGGGPLNKGVIQLLYAGTGQESRTFSGPEATSVSDHEESATSTVG